MLHCPDPRLDRALKYALNNQGKRLRSQITIATAAMFSGTAAGCANTVGEAIEYLHTYSLIHDDLPAMDDDDLRRGQPTLHKAFDEATAILAGDGLQAAAFELIATEEDLTPLQRLELITLISRAVGFQGMVGGQAMDMAAEGNRVNVESLRQLHSLKTGALITASVVAGAICAGATAEQKQTLQTFGDLIGLAFQITDDILDVTQSSDALGKTAGKDIAADKSTYISTLGLEGAQTEAEALLQEALELLARFGDGAEPLRALALKMVRRSF